MVPPNFFHHHTMKPATAYSKAPQASRTISPSYTSTKDISDSLYTAARTKLRATLSPTTPTLDSVTDGLARDLSNQLAQTVPYGTRKEMINLYQKARLTKEITDTKGNIAEITRNLYPSTTGDARHSVYRAAKKFDLMDYIDHKRPEVQKPLQPTYDSAIKSQTIESTLQSSLANYKDDLHPIRYSELSTKIAVYAPELAKDLSGYVPTKENLINDLVEKTQGMSWKESVQYIEKAVIISAMQNAGFDKKKAADYLKDPVDKLNRRIRQLGIKDDIEAAKKEQASPKEELVEAEPKTCLEEMSEIEILRLRTQEQKDKLAVEERPKKTTTDEESKLTEAIILQFPTNI